MLYVRTLGELRLADDAGASRSLRRKPLALAAYLARCAPRPVTRTELATMFWGERGEDRARQSLRQALVEIKQTLEDVIDIGPESVGLAAGGLELDVAAFERDVAEGRYAEAVERWQGDFFEGAEESGGEGLRRWIEVEREGLHRQLSLAMDRLTADLRASGDWPGVLALARRWTAALPVDETAHQRLIEALRRNDRPTEALQVHAAFTTTIRGVLDAEPSDGFRTLGEVLAEEVRTSALAGGRRIAAIRSPEMVGRDGLVAELERGWRAVRAGGSAVFLIRGEPGSGRSTLCGELARRLAEEATVCRIAGDPADPPLGGARRLFAGLDEAPGVAGADPAALAELSRIAPGLSRRFPSLPPPQETDAGLAAALGSTLAAMAEERPVLVIADDFGRMDAATGGLLESLAAGPPAGLMLVTVESEGGDPAAPGLPAGLRSVHRLQVEPLTPADVDALLRSMLSMDDAERRDLAATLHRDSGGLPAPIVDLVTTLVDDHLLILDPTGLWRPAPALAAGALPVPGPFRERMGRRLESLSLPARLMLEAAALVERPVPASGLAMIAGLREDEPAGAATELRARRLAVETRGSVPGLTAASPIIGRTVLALMPAARRSAMEGRRDSSVPRSVEARPGTTRAPFAARMPGRLAIAAVVAAAVMVGALLLRRPAPASPTGGTPPPDPIVALGRIVDYRNAGDAAAVLPLTDMLATNLGRVRGLRVVSAARMYELIALVDPERRDTSAATLVSAARQAGATELLDGSLYVREDGRLRLDLRRMELATGNLRETYSVTGASIFDLADSGTARLAQAVGRATPEGSIADVTTRSEGAYRLYEQGLRAYFALDFQTAQLLFDAALEQDSTFAMAAYYSALTATENLMPPVNRFERATRLAARASDRERLTILARAAFLESSAALEAIADTLVVRYPDEVEGYYYTGLARLVAGRFLEGILPLERVLVMDSLALSGRRAQCAACDALRQIVSAYQLADSLPAAERAARRWTRLQPESPVSWHYLADVLSQQGRPDEAEAALDLEATFDGGRREGARMLGRAMHRFYAGRFDEMERILEAEIESGLEDRVVAALWYRSLGLRQQGRLEEALRSNIEHRRRTVSKYPAEARRRRGAAAPEAFGQAQVLYEMGRFRQAAALFDSVAQWEYTRSSSFEAHWRAWAETHVATALAAAGDTAGFLARADSLEVWGRASANGRDRGLHHYVRGLLHAARGHHDVAVGEFKAAVFSWNFGYTRVNVALATSLERLGRPREAVTALQQALRGTAEASNFYVTRTELHERLGQAWLAVGGGAARDSAAAHFRFVVEAWKRADPQFADRRRAAETHLTELAQSGR